MKTKWLLVFIFMVGVYSCNPARLVVKNVDKKYRRWGTTEKLVSTGDAKINVRVLGEGKKNVLLIHGYGPLPQAQWMRQARELRKDYRVIIPDLVYFGDSRSSSGEYSIDFQVRQLGILLDTLDIEEVNVVGLSYGGMVAATFASEYESRVNSLVLVDALSRYYEREHVDSLIRANDVEYIGDLLLPDNVENLRKLYQFTFRKRKIPRFLARNILETLYQDQRPEKLGVLAYIDREVDYLASRDYQVDVPVLLVWGAEDMLVPVRNAVSLHNYYNNSTIAFIPEAGHTPNFEQPREFNQTVLDFLQQPR